MAATDYQGRRIWEAASPYHDDGRPIKFRIVELGEGFFGWDHDAELQFPECRGLAFSRLEDAKQVCQEYCDELVETEFGPA